MTKAYSSYRAHPIKIVDRRQHTEAKFCNESEDKEQAETPKLFFPAAITSRIESTDLITLHNVSGE